MIARICVLAVLAAAIALPAHADAPCPESCISVGAVTTECAATSARDSMVSASCYPYPGQLEEHAAFDLVLGTALASARSCSFPGPSGFASVVARDRYRVIGPVGGSISFSARVHAQGAASGFGSVGVTLQEVGGGSAHVDEGTVGGFDQYLELPLSHAPGEEFVLAIDSYASAEGYAQATAALMFTGLPPGYGVSSCQGFSGPGAVPARQSSWGGLKSRYR